MTTKEPWQMTKEEYLNNTDSEVKDVVYHWGKNPPEQAVENDIIWFSDEKEVHKDKAKTVHYRWIKIKNPLELPGIGELGEAKPLADWLSILKDKGLDVEKLDLGESVTENDNSMYFGEILEYKNNFPEVASAAGYDGFIAPSGSWTTDHTEYGVFSPRQLIRWGGHIHEVRKALTSGKPVPPEVLKDYPDLAKPSDAHKWAEGKDLQKHQFARLKEINQDRGSVPRKADMNRSNKMTVEPYDKTTKRWRNNPGSMDILGVDTPPSVTRATRFPRISPKTPRLR
jgi:hypothetical protein